MEEAAYAAEAAIEASHWWYVGRRRLFAREIGRLGLGPNAPILDIGTSTGTNLRMLRDMQFRNVDGLDFSEEAIRFCTMKGLGRVEQGDICAMPWPDSSFDLVLATDIVEHVENDRQALAEIVRVLTPGGHVLITVPTFQSLWGHKDEFAHHKRRYRLQSLLDLARGPGLVIERSYYFNYILFVPIWLVRQILLLTNPANKAENQMNTPLLNRALGAVFHVDVATAGLLHPPFGVSALVLARKPDHKERSSPAADKRAA